MNIGIRSGIRIGLPLGILALIVSGLYDSGHLPGAVQAGEFVVAVIAFIVAGLIAGSPSGRVMAGAIAGIVTSLFMAIVILGANIVMAAIAPAAFAHAFGYHDITASSLVGAAVLQSLGGLFAWAIIGSLFGMLGGWIGTRRKVKQLVA